MSVSAGVLMLRAKRRADMENSQFVSDGEWLDLLNEGLSRLHDIVVGKNEDYFVESEPYTLVASQDEYTLPSDFLRVRGVDLDLGGTIHTLDEFSFAERNRLQFWSDSVVTDVPTFWHVRGESLILIPTPSGSGTLTLWYIPQCQKLRDGADQTSARYPDAWLRYPILHAASCALKKEQNESAAIEAELGTAKDEIEAACKRTAHGPRRVVNVRRNRDLIFGR